MQKKHLTKSITPFHDKNKLGIEGNFPNLIEGIYGKPRVNIIVNGETEKLSPKMRNKTRMFTLALLFSIVLEILTSEVGQERRIKDI